MYLKPLPPIAMITCCLFILTLLTGCQTYIDSNPSLPAILHPPKKVVLLLPLQGEWKERSQAIQAGFNLANRFSNYPLKVHVVDTTSGYSIKESYLQGADSDTDLVIGPLLKSQVNELSHFHDMKKPVLTLDCLERGKEAPANFYQFSLSSLDEAKQAALQAWKKGLKHALVITSDDQWGQEVAHAFRDQWEALGGTLVDQLNCQTEIQSLDAQIKKFLDFNPPDKRREDFDVIFLSTTSALARQINPLLAYYFAGNIPIYATASIYNAQLPFYLNRDLDPIIVCDTYWSLEKYHVYPELVKQLKQFETTLFQKHRRYYGLGIDAFYLAMQLVVFDQDETKMIEGACGRLFLNRNRCFVRTMPCAQFKRGVPKIVNQAINHLPCQDNAQMTMADTDI